ncbi:MAG: 30S ribosomal protein S12 methylthiotransferase RimO [Spirochaetia bacterium]|nr:30S ribosomal protein S12 methylthiotransferase RimO [Spirochaetia bacterium]
MKKELSEKTFYIENLGCAKNQVDAETIIKSLTGRGWVYSPADTAAMIIINTCGFIKPAKEESIQTLISFRQQYPDRKIVLAGCLAQRYGKDLASSLPEADAIFGNRFPEKIALVADDFINGRKKLYIPDKKSGSLPPGGIKDSDATAAGSAGSGADNKTGTETEIDSAPVKSRDGSGSGFSPAHGSGSRISLSFPGSTYVKIAEGCNNNCTYCAIPLIRGPLESRDENGIIEEIKELADTGFNEINLIAQDLASFGNDRGKANGRGSSLLTLLEKISLIKGEFWIRLLYMHPDKFDREIYSIMKEDRRILPYFDIPFQHASERILSRMGRKGNFESYLDLVEDIRGNIKDAVIRSTFLLGFPGETTADFRQLTDFIKQARLDWAGFFQFSREEGTPAEKMGKGLSDFILSRKTPKRISILKALQTSISEENLEKYTGMELDILAEERIEGEEIVLGRGYLNAPDIDGAVIIHSSDVVPGNMVKCRITRRNNLDLEAVPL